MLPFVPRMKPAFAHCTVFPSPSSLPASCHMLYLISRLISHASFSLWAIHHWPLMKSLLTLYDFKKKAFLLLAGKSVMWTVEQSHFRSNPECSEYSLDFPSAVRKDGGQYFTSGVLNFHRHSPSLILSQASPHNPKSLSPSTRHVN